MQRPGRWRAQVHRTWQQGPLQGVIKRDHLPPTSLVLLPPLPPPQVVEWVRRNSAMKMYGPGEVIWEPPGAALPRDGEEDGPAAASKEAAASATIPGMFVVISGVVRLDLDFEDRAVPMFLGSGDSYIATVWM